MLKDQKHPGTSSTSLKMCPSGSMTYFQLMLLYIVATSEQATRQWAQRCVHVHTTASQSLAYAWLVHLQNWS